ncbi:hypothetical protein IU433_04890 [Nocardia puris]|uniref:Nitroreductase family protein n=1 Tax=Nocardia puris TaxID=208602 RepID=A0A366E110_9NOCA|nr:hypothetical protein [Nocardia puris]MBF6209710.1 hypothetical protein [Nocardia puris]MBF6366282.1 hypothetical protein [Nocardia puris]MBF6458379.1 hypothetical protein [Nocardia puris]RBO96022.1 hypothetical protein DFR74_10133 [Nocardia puris]
MNRSVPDDATVRAVVARANRAPSLHNSQPWRWRWNGVRLALAVDTGRLLPGTDAFNRQGVLGCGVALHHAVTAMTAMGWRPVVSRFPEPADRAHLASLEFRGRTEVFDGDVELADAIEARCSDRAPYAHPEQWPRLLPVLLELCARHDTRLLPIADAECAALAEVAWTASALRRRDPVYQHEMTWWLGGGEPGSGVPAAALPHREDGARVPLNREFLPGTSDSGPERRDGARIVALGTRDESAESLLAGGEALSALLLECTVHGLSTCVMSHLTELPAARAKVVEVIGDPHPQVFVRIGRSTAPRPPRTPRRDVDDVLTTE